MQYSDDGVSFADIDECMTEADNCHADASCTNSDGSFTFACSMVLPMMKLTAPTSMNVLQEQTIVMPMHPLLMISVASAALVMTVTKAMESLALTSMNVMVTTCSQPQVSVRFLPEAMTVRVNLASPEMVSMHLNRSCQYQQDIYCN